MAHPRFVWLVGFSSNFQVEKFSGRRKKVVYFFLLIGGYSSVGRALPLQWCRMNNFFIGRSFSFYTRIQPNEEVSFIPNALPPFQVDGMGTITWRVSVSSKAPCKKEFDETGGRIMGGQEYSVWVVGSMVLVRPGRPFQNRNYGWGVGSPTPVQAGRYTHSLRKHLGSLQRLVPPPCSA